MKSRPTIFLSGVSHEFGSFRDAVENEIEMKGCFAENQPGFPPDYCTVEEMLRRKLHDADAVIHIVGFRFGAEPKQRPEEAPRRSYTQMEYDIARELQKPLYVFLSTATSVRDEPMAGEKSEDDEAKEFQLAHREAVQQNHLYYYFKDQADLCKLAAEIPPVQATGFHAEISRIVKHAPAQLIGRDDELKILDDAWAKVRRDESPRPHVLTFVALGGEGKTSLVAKWAANLAHQGWPGADAVFAWSFYSQGTREQTAASSDLFLQEALTAFGDPAIAGSAKGAFDKGRRLAQLVGERRALLILDGLEPLQYAPTSPTPGELKDQGVFALLRGLATTNHGLCVVTTRFPIADLRAYWQTTAPETKLPRLSREAGVALLRLLGVKGQPKEFEALVEDVKGHALTLNLLGAYIQDAHAGDIRKRDLVKLEEADAEEQGGHAFRVMDAYVRWFESDGEKGKRAIALLRLMGLFDRPATIDCLAALQAVPPTPGLTESLVGMSEVQRNVAYTRLEATRLLTVSRDAAGTLVSLDTHPLLRDYFARQLRIQRPEAWRDAHRRLYEHLSATTLDMPMPKLEDLQPLYEAVVHGCQAGLQQKAYEETWSQRICRGKEYYSTKKLGAYGSDLGALTCFFDQPWHLISPVLREVDQSWVGNDAAFCLRALGRLSEALIPLRIGLNIAVTHKEWVNASVCACNLSEMRLTLGEVAGAVGDAEQSVTYADHSGDAFHRMVSRTELADALYHAGHQDEAVARFREAEAQQPMSRPDYPLLYSARGFKYCSLLLAASERAAWKCTLERVGFQRGVTGVLLETPLGADPLNAPLSHEGATSSTVQETPCSRPATPAPEIQSCRAVYQRAAQTLKWERKGNWLLDMALDQLTMGRAALYEAILGSSSLDPCYPLVQQAVAELRLASTQDHLPRGLLTRAWLRSLVGARTGPDSAQSDLDEALEIVERGPMALFLADVHLYRARLFFQEPHYPWDKAPDGSLRGPKDDLADARRLIRKYGYGLRQEELKDAEDAILREPEN